jgi:ribosomal protein S7
MNKFKFKYYANIKIYNKIFYLLLIKLIGRLLKRGNKLRSINSIFNFKYLLKKKINVDPNFILLYSLLKSLLKVYFIKIKLGGKFKELPIALLKERQVRFAARDFLKFSKSKKSKLVNLNNLCNIILLTCRKKGPLIRKNYKAYRKALDNRVLLFLIRK